MVSINRDVFKRRGFTGKLEPEERTILPDRLGGGDASEAVLLISG
jgi:hypothetical protein